MDPAEADRFVAEAGAAVLVTVTLAEGSTPREAGAAMLVSAERTLGTIGGGRAEFDAIAAAQAMMRAGRERFAERVALGPALDQCCGGAMTLAYRRVGPGDALAPAATAAPVWLYGAGHVGRAIAAALAPLPVALTWIDPRPDGFDGAPALEATRLTTPLPEAAAADAPPAVCHLVLTHSHAVDLEIVTAVLARGDARFCGLIGSATKRAVFERRLSERGVPTDRLTCPIGLPGLRDKRPAVIAASVAAQVLGVVLSEEPVP